MSKFPNSAQTKVDDLLRIYDGLEGEIDAALKTSQISGALPMPSLPSALEPFVTWCENNGPLPPDDITDLSDLELGKLNSYLRNWTSYVAAEVTRAKCLVAQQTAHLKVMQAALRIHYQEVGIAQGMLKDHVLVDSRYVEVNYALLKLETFHATAASREAQLRGTLALISREQTRRASQLEELLHSSSSSPSRPERAFGAAPFAGRGS